jgi:hypothetical protein
MADAFAKNEQIPSLNMAHPIHKRPMKTKQTPDQSAPANRTAIEAKATLQQHFPEVEPLI